MFGWFKRRSKKEWVNEVIIALLVKSCNPMLGHTDNNTKSLSGRKGSNVFYLKVTQTGAYEYCLHLSDNKRFGIDFHVSIQSSYAISQIGIGRKDGYCTGKLDDITEERMAELVDILRKRFGLTPKLDNIVFEPYHPINKEIRYLHYRLFDDYGKLTP